MANLFMTICDKF